MSDLYEIIQYDWVIFFQQVFIVWIAFPGICKHNSKHNRTQWSSNVTTIKYYFQTLHVTYIAKHNQVISQAKGEVYNKVSTIATF